MAQPTPEVTEKEVPRMMNRLNNDLDRLHGRLTELEKMLDPVIHAPAEAQSEAKSTADNLCAHAGSLRDHASSVEEAISRVDYLLANLQV